ncbi:MAG: NUDIX domain-containing protein [Bryobacterales bacterium]|nr:NUDIX domain-containing protein [Bryobacterales bacterium]
MPNSTGGADLVRAAGGIVWRDSKRRELAVIYRDRYEPNECCLPKGKLDPGEDWERAAVREVLEETGCEAEIAGFAGLLHYQVGKGPKVVVYFDMLAIGEGEFVPSSEVTKMAWLTPAEALGELAHQGERELLSEFLARS